MKFPVAVSLAAACLVPIEATWSIPASAQQAPALPTLPSPDGTPPVSPPAESAPPELPRTVRVHMVTNATGVQFLFRPASASPSQPLAAGDVHQYIASCVAPCDLELPVGDYYVALSRSGGPAYEHGTPLWLRSASTIDGTYRSLSPARITGIVLLSTLVPAGLVLALAGAEANSSSCTVQPGFTQCTPNPDTGLIAGGIATTAIGLVIGTILLTRRDQIGVQVVPPTGPIAAHGGESERTSGANGLALKLTF